ncbi:MAG: DUF86 domain-containing protein [Patescibacteria group bacterium]
MTDNKDQLHILHMSDAIKKIEAYTKGLTFAQFAKNEMDFDAVMMQFVIIGEAANQISDQFKEKHHSFPWHQAVGLRNQIAHGYFEIEPKIVWQTIQEDLSFLKKQLFEFKKTWK